MQLRRDVRVLRLQENCSKGSWLRSSHDLNGHRFPKSALMSDLISLTGRVLVCSTCTNVGRLNIIGVWELGSKLPKSAAYKGGWGEDSARKSRRV